MKKLKAFFETPTGKVILEAGRWAVLGAVSIFVTRLLELVPGLKLDPTFELALLAFLRFADRLLHQSEIVEKGIVPF